MKKADSHKAWRGINDSVFEDGVYNSGREAVYKIFTDDVIALLREQDCQEEVKKILIERDTLLKELEGKNETLGKAHQ